MFLQPLQEGDIVDIVAPASRCSNLELRNGLKALRALGLVPRVPKNLFAPSLLFANSDAVRLRQLQAALKAPDSKMIWCVRGGYGSLRLLPALHKMSRPKHAKIVLGYSDITTLHSFLNQEWKWPTLHGPLLDRLGRGAMSAGERRELLSLLFGRNTHTQFKNLKALNRAAHVERTIRGRILGGNMAVLQSSLGTPSQLKSKGHILFFEDTGERPHRVDRMLTQFEQAGWFKNARAVVFGHFLLSDPKDRRQLWSDVIPRFAEAQRLPVLAGLKVGHNSKQQFPLPFYTPSVLRMGRKPELVVESGISPVGEL
ncbi:MAG: LD-carboxypeptidase [Bdellovibrionales bacterium]|nr:LD-carboxypeptidase [Bdellovibrionales bacterium]